MLGRTAAHVTDHEQPLIEQECSSRTGIVGERSSAPINLRTFTELVGHDRIFMHTVMFYPSRKSAADSLARTDRVLKYL